MFTKQAAAGCTALNAAWWTSESFLKSLRFSPDACSSSRRFGRLNFFLIIGEESELSFLLSTSVTCAEDAEFFLPLAEAELDAALLTVFLFVSFDDTTVFRTRPALAVFRTRPALAAVTFEAYFSLILATNSASIPASARKMFLNGFRCCQFI